LLHSVTQCFVNNGLADKTSTEPGLAEYQLSSHFCITRGCGIP